MVGSGIDRIIQRISRTSFGFEWGDLGFGIWEWMIPEDAVCCVPAGQRIIQEWTDEPLAAKSEMRTEHTIPISIRVIADALTFIVLGPVSVICCKEDQLIPL